MTKLEIFMEFNVMDDFTKDCDNLCVKYLLKIPDAFQIHFFNFQIKIKLDSFY